MKNILQGYLFASIAFSAAYGQQPCSAPDKPLNGSYKPENKTYKPQDEVVYSCDPGFTRVGKEIRTCQLNRKWSDSTPFCDFPTRTRNPLVDRNPVIVRKVIDGNINTCYPLDSIGSKLQLFLAEDEPVYALRIYFDSGKVKIGVKLNPLNITCTNYNRYLQSGTWAWLHCEKNDTETSSVTITGTDGVRNNISICEIEVFVKKNNMCDRPPERYISNGHLIISRNKADLKCDEGYMDKNGRLVCESNIWRDSGPLCEEITCDPIVPKTDGGVEWSFSDAKKFAVGTRKRLKCGGDLEISGEPSTIECLKDGTWTKTNATCREKSKRKIIAAVVGSFVALIILVLLGIMIFLIYRQKHKEIVVVLKQSDDGSTAANDLQYSTVLYETIRQPPVPPATARPTILPPLYSDVYSQPADQKDAHKARTMPADIAFGTLKQSTLYGS